MARAETAPAGGRSDLEAFVALPYDAAGRAPEIPLDQGLAQTARAYREAGWL